MTDGSQGDTCWLYHQSGPFLVLYGHGLNSEDVGVSVCEQCTAHGVVTVIHAIDELKQVELGRFTGLVAVLPLQPGDLAADLRLFADVIRDYRARRPDGLESILDRSCQWFDAGVVQVIGQRAIIQRFQIQCAQNRVCAWHYTDESELTDVFGPYLLAPQLDDELAREKIAQAEPVWTDLKAWGVADTEQVQLLLKCIENCRSRYEGARYSVLRRPRPGNQNMLDIVLVLQG